MDPEIDWKLPLTYLGIVKKSRSNQNSCHKKFSGKTEGVLKLTPMKNWVKIQGNQNSKRKSP